MTEKRCPSCAQVKPVSEYHRNRSTGDGLQTWCKPCHSGGPDQRKRRDYTLRHFYGLTVSEFEAMLSAQDGLCAICRQPGTSEKRGRRFLHVDHDHATNAVRGLLCSECNIGIGKFKDDAGLMQRAINYIGDAGAELWR